MKLLLPFLLIITFSFTCKAEIIVKNIKPGHTIGATWNDLPVIVYKRTDSEIEALKTSSQEQTNFEIAKRHYRAIQHFALSSGNELATELFGNIILEKLESRSVQKEILVVLGVSSRAQCYIETDINKKTFFDPCSQAQYDTNGRILKPNNRENHHLLIPPHYYKDGNLIIGLESSEPLKTIDFSPDIMSIDTSSGQKLVTALMWNKDELVTILLKDTNVVKFQTPTGATALHIAANKSTPKIINQLVQAGFDINLPTKDGISPIQFATIYDNISTAREFIKLGAVTGSYCVKDRCTIELEEFISIFKPDLSPDEIRNYISQLHEK